jgi:hypothetical protein
MTPADPLETLHLARIRGLVPAELLGDVDELVEQGLLVATPRGAMLTAAGLDRHDELLSAWRSSVDLDPLASAYERFLAVNQPMKDACSAWQTQGSGPDALFLAVDALSGIVDRVAPVLRRAGQTVPRFAGYSTRLQGAVQAAQGGDGRFLTDPRVDSVHSVWFECHEDFLTTLGRSREEEGSF